MSVFVIESNLPESVKEFTYARNCHYLKLKDLKGREVKLIEQGLVRYWCLMCSALWFQTSNNATCCPVCEKSKISAQWVRPQMALVPEHESDFVMPGRDDDDGE